MFLLFLLFSLMTIPENSNVIKPQPGGQWEYFTRGEYEVLFGGAAGPGKSWALVIDALGLQYKNMKLGKAAIEVPEYRAVLFRRKTTQLSKLIDEAKKYYCASPFNAEFVSHRQGDPGPSLNFPSGARIFMCHMEQEMDKENHQGIEYQFVGFDELSQFTLTQYLYLFSRLRSKIPGLTCRIRSTTNPTGAGLVWVRKRFIKNGTNVLSPRETYYFLPANDPEENPQGIRVEKGTEFAKSRCFVPGNLYENKILMENDPGYVSNIYAMGDKMKRALLDGDWDAFSGDFFEDFDSKKMCVKPFEIPAEWNLIGALDPGWASPCSFSLYAKDFEGNIYLLFTYYVKNSSPLQHRDDILSMIKTFPYTQIEKNYDGKTIKEGRIPKIIISGHDAWARKDKNAILANDTTWEQMFGSVGLYLQKAVTDRVPGWQMVKQMMRHNKFYYFEGYNDSAVEEIIAAEHDDNDVEDIKGRGNSSEVQDHFLDEFRYMAMSFYTPVKHKEPEIVSRPNLVISDKRGVTKF